MRNCSTRVREFPAARLDMQVGEDPKAHGSHSSCCLARVANNDPGLEVSPNLKYIHVYPKMVLR
jgi:hypothetical protein